MPSVRFSFVAYHLVTRFSPLFRGPNPFYPPRLPAAPPMACSVKHSLAPHAGGVFAPAEVHLGVQTRH